MLRAKVSVFAELWTKTQQLAAQAEIATEAAAVAADVRTALDALSDLDKPDVETAVDVLRRALRRADAD